MAVDELSLLPYGQHLIMNQNVLVGCCRANFLCLGEALDQTVHTFSGWMAAQVSYLDTTFHSVFP
jgi:hypothetical protein